MNRQTRIKVCGLTLRRDVECCVRLGVDSIGLNFWPGTPRVTSANFAAEMVTMFPEQEFVGVFVDASLAEIERIRDQTGIRWVQLHGDETPSELEACQPLAYKALRLAEENDVQQAALFGGERILVDARVAGHMPGGTGHSFPWDWAKSLSAQRKVVLAGGLGPENVADAITAIRPWQVDVASGVESSPGCKDHDLLRRFVEAVE
ncbi:MAG: phosphoribosylanthranilate isomerase [Polyangiales bacterium]|jgi:phosphoribosylanthranilate isomerase